MVIETRKINIESIRQIEIQKCVHKLRIFILVFSNLFNSRGAFTRKWFAETQVVQELLHWTTANSNCLFYSKSTFNPTTIEATFRRTWKILVLHTG